MTEHDQHVVLGIVVRYGRVLMIRRTKGDGISWSFPGGKVEAGETIFSACERELYEEVGLSCRSDKEIGWRQHPESLRTVHYVLCTASTGAAWNRESEKADAVSWLTLDEVESHVGSTLFPPVVHAIATSNSQPLLAHTP